MLLKQTSILVAISNDLRPLKGPDDTRLAQLSDVLQWFEQWEKNLNKKTIMSYQTMEDIKSMLAGLIHLTDNHFREKRSYTAVVPGRINSDVIENFFCQQRTLVHGANTNPTAKDYGIAVNALILLQAPMSKKRNSFNNDQHLAAKMLKPEITK